MDDASQSRVAIAALFAALVEALDEHSSGLALSFARHLDETKAKLDEGGGDNRAALDTLAWTKTLLRDEHDRTQPAYVVYAKPRIAEEDLLPSSEKVPLATLDEAVRFWARLPAFDRAHATVETASGHRFDAMAVSVLAKRYKDLPAL